MLDLLNKYYEFFLNGNFQDRVSTNGNSEFYKFYKIIINEYNVSKDAKLRVDIKFFFEFFDEVDFGGLRRKGVFRDYIFGEDDIKEYFEGLGCSFEFFKASEHMVSDGSFIYSVDNSDDIFCKVYLSIKPDKYPRVMQKIQEFVDQLFVNHPNDEIGQCKFRNVPANDAIVMRFATKEHYNEFLEFLDKNPDIISSYDVPSPFMPRDSHGLSIIPDNHGSYNYFVTRMIWDYMFECREKQQPISIEGIVEFINLYDYSNDEMLSSNGSDIMECYKSILIGKLLSINDEEILTNIFGKDNIKIRKI